MRRQIQPCTDLSTSVKPLFLRFNGLVVMISVLHTEGPQFDPGLNHLFFFFAMSSTRLVWIVLVLHTLYIVNTLLTPPPNLFTALSIPLNSPTDAIQAALQRSAQAPLPDYLNALLRRFDSFELRSLYIRYLFAFYPYLILVFISGPFRFGHNVVLTCEHCGTMEDYALYALPRPALAYLREIALVGVRFIDRAAPYRADHIPLAGDAGEIEPFSPTLTRSGRPRRRLPHRSLLSWYGPHCNPSTQRTDTCRRYLYGTLYSLLFSS